MATPTVFSFTLQDDDGVKASMLAYASYDGAVETVDGLIGTWLALGAAVDDVTGAVITDGHIKIPLASDASWKDTAAAGHSVSDTLNLVFNNEDTIYGDTIVVPALLDSLVSAGRPVITEGSAIDVLADILETSFTNGAYVNSAGSNLTTLREAFQGVRKHRKQLSARSKWRPSV